MYLARARPYELGDIPLVVLLTNAGQSNPPGSVSAEEWKRVQEDNRRQKLGFTNLSHDSKLIIAEHSGHFVALEEPQVVTNSIRLVVDAVRRRTRLARSG